MTNNTQSGKSTSTGLRILAVLSFLVVLSVGMWGSVQVAKAVPNAFSSLAAAIVSLSSIFVPANTSEQITLSTPALTVSSGEDLTVSWEHTNKTAEGSYTFRYDCANGVHFTSLSGATSDSTVFCNVPFHFLNNNNSITLTPVSGNNRFVDVTIFIDFTPNGISAATVTGSMVLTIVNENISASPGTIAPTTPTPTTPATVPQPKPTVTPTKGTETITTYPSTPVTVTPPVSDPNGRVDLTAYVIETGTVNTTTGVFTASSTPKRNPEGARIAVRFAIENIGTKTSPQFTFNAVLPTYPSHIFSSPGQQILNPGDRIEYTLAFDSFVDSDEGVFTVNVDPTGSINEPNKDNNIIHYTVKVVR